MSGWVKLHRSITKHWLFEDPEFFRAWIIMVTQANYEDKSRMFNSALLEVKRGQFVFGLEAFSATSKMSISKLRRLLKLLEKEQMISRQKTNKYSVISITNYNEYQSDDRLNDSQDAGKEQAKNRQDDKLAATPKEVKKERKKEVKKESARKRFIAPSVDEVYQYFLEQGVNDNDLANKFVDHYKSNGWKVGGKSPMKDWKAAIRSTWMRNNGASKSKAIKVKANDQASFVEKHQDDSWAAGL